MPMTVPTKPPALSVLLPREQVSLYENRTLATFPQLTVRSLMSGTFVSGVEDYLTDHLVGRNQMLEAYARSSIAIRPSIERRPPSFFSTTTDSRPLTTVMPNAR